MLRVSSKGSEIYCAEPIKYIKITNSNELESKIYAQLDANLQKSIYFQGSRAQF